MSTQTRLVTAEEFSRMPDNDRRQELVAGEVRESPLPFHEHGRLAMKFAVRLGQHVEANDLGTACAESGFVLARDPDTVRGPDVGFISKARVEAAPKGGYFPGAPDLAVEVLSPGDRRGRVEAKVAAWFDGGCLMVVLVNPKDRTLKVYRSATNVVVLTEKETFDGADVVPGFKLPVAVLFAD